MSKLSAVALLVTLAASLTALFAAPAQAEGVVARTDPDQDGNFIAQLVAVGRVGQSVNISAPVTLNAPLPAGATLDRLLLVNGGRHIVYLAFAGDAAAFDDLFVVDVANPGVATMLNAPRVVGVDSPIVFAANTGSSRVAYALRNTQTGTDRLFVADVESPGLATLIYDQLPSGSTIRAMELSPDGESLAYLVDQPSVEPQLWMSFLRAPQNGQRIDAPAPLSNYEPNEFQFSANARHFLWRGNQSVAGQAEPLRAVRMDPFRRTITAPAQLNPGTALNEQVFEFDIDSASERVYYRAIAGNSSLPGDTFSVALDQPGQALRLNPPPVPGAGFTAQEDVLVLGDRVLYNSAQSRADLVELFSVPLDGSAVSTRLSGSLQLNQISGSESQAGVSHMVASRTGALVALVDGEPAQNLFVVDITNPALNAAPFDLLATNRTIEQTSRSNGTRIDPFSFSPGENFIAVLVDPDQFDPAIDPPDLGSELLVAVPDVDASARSAFPASPSVAGFAWLADRTALAAAVLPASRSGQTGATLTAFVSVINGGAVVGQDCRIGLQTDLPVAFSFQPTDPLTNVATGNPNSSVDMQPGAVQTWLVALEVLEPFAPTDVRFRFGCANSDPVGVIAGVNTLLLSGASAPVPDMVALAATPNANGTLDIPGTNGNAAFSVATINLGSSAAITVQADTAGATLPIALALCETDATGACINPAGGSSDTVSFTAGVNATHSFSVFVGAAGSVADAAAVNRVRVVFRDSNGVIRGQTSVAVRTAP